MKLDIRVNYNGIRINGLRYILIVGMYMDYVVLELLVYARTFKILMN